MTRNTLDEQRQIDIPLIQIDDRVFSDASKILRKIVILKQDGKREYVIERTKAGGYLMK
jgi:hypothetical protein